MASRKDARDAVVAARKAFHGWSAATAYNRGQVLYRVAELMEGRRGAVRRRGARRRGAARPAGPTRSSTRRSTGGSGTPDGRTRSPQVLGSANPVAGPYFDFSVPEPTGVVAVLAPQQSSLLGLVSVIAPAIVTGNTVVVLASEDAPAARRSRCPRCSRRPTCPAVSSTCSPAAPPRSRPGSPRTWTSTRSTWPARPRATSSRSRWPAPTTSSASCGPTPRASRLGPRRPASSGLLAYLETKTVWHPIGV